jgi:hypothetical protein
VPELRHFRWLAVDRDGRAPNRNASPKTGLLQSCSPRQFGSRLSNFLADIDIFELSQTDDFDESLARARLSIETHARLHQRLILRAAYRRAGTGIPPERTPQDPDRRRALPGDGPRPRARDRLVSPGSRSSMLSPNKTDPTSLTISRLCRCSPPGLCSANTTSTDAPAGSRRGRYRSHLRRNSSGGGLRYRYVRSGTG